MSLIEKLQWRAAVKKFDTTKKITADQLDGLLSAVQLAPTNLDEDFGKKFIDLVASTRSVERESLEGYEQMVLGALSSRTDEQKLAWSHKQAYIALGVLLSAAADLGIDAGPMEGFDPQKFDEILGLKEKGLTTSVIAAIGFRAEDDVYSKMIKVRRPKKELFIHV